MQAHQQQQQQGQPQYQQLQLGSKTHRTPSLLLLLLPPAIPLQGLVLLLVLLTEARQ
jgi:hypothetical protein